MTFLSNLLTPIVNVILSPFRATLAGGLAFFGLIFWMIFVLCVSIFKLLTLDLANYLMFGLRPSEDLTKFQTIRPYAQFLIISIALWMISFLFLLIRFAKETDSQKANEIMKDALKQSATNILILLVFQILILLCNWLLSAIINLFIGSEAGSLEEIANKIIYSFVPKEGFIEGNYTEPFPIKGLGIPNPFWGFAYTTWYEFTAKIYGYSLIIGLGTLITGIFISLPIMASLFDVVGKIFVSWILFITFPIIPALSMNDGGKKMRIWKEKYFGNMVACGVYLVGITLMGMFIGTTINFIESTIVGDVKGLFGLSNNTNIQASSFVYMLILGLIYFVIAMGSVMGFKKLSEVMIAFIGSDVNNDKVRSTTAKGVKAGAKYVLKQHTAAKDAAKKAVGGIAKAAGK